MGRLYKYKTHRTQPLLTWYASIIPLLLLFPGYIP